MAEGMCGQQWCTRGQVGVSQVGLDIDKLLEKAIIPKAWIIDEMDINVSVIISALVGSCIHTALITQTHLHPLGRDTCSMHGIH